MYRSRILIQAPEDARFELGILDEKIRKAGLLEPSAAILKEQLELVLRQAENQLSVHRNNFSMKRVFEGSAIVLVDVNSRSRLFRSTY